MKRPLTICLALLLLHNASFFVQSADKKSPLEKARDELLKLHNNARKKQKCAALVQNEKLTSAAQKYAEFMAESGKFGHNEQGTPEERVKAEGYASNSGGENIAWGLPSPGRVFAIWMKSEVHRDNILREEFTEVGFGIAENAKGELYWVTNFGTPAAGGEAEPGETDASESKAPGR